MPDMLLLHKLPVLRVALGKEKVYAGIHMISCWSLSLSTIHQLCRIMSTFYPQISISAWHFALTVYIIYKTFFRYRIFKETEVTRSWRWHYSLRKDRDLRFMVSEPEWAQLAEEKFLPQEELKVELNLQFNTKDRSQSGPLYFLWKIFLLLKRMTTSGP